MKNTKENRIKFLRKQFELLGKNQDKLSLAAEGLNNALSRKRQIVIVKNWSELRSELGSELWSEILSELRSELRSELESALRSVFEYFENNWILFVNEFNPQLKILQKNKNKNKIEALKSLVNSGNAYILISKTKLFILPFPEVHLNMEKKLHNEKGYALKFADEKSYWLCGVKFEEPLWEKIVKKEISAKEILKLENIEQRMVALKMLGTDKMLDELGAKLINQSLGYELYLVDNLFSQKAYFLKYKDPSTNRIYVSGVDPEVGKSEDAVACIAWKFNLGKEAFEDIKIFS